MFVLEPKRFQENAWRLLTLALSVSRIQKFTANCIPERKARSPAPVKYVESPCRLIDTTANDNVLLSVVCILVFITSAGVTAKADKAPAVPAAINELSVD